MSRGNYFLPKSQTRFVVKRAYKNSSGSQTCKLFQLDPMPNTLHIGSKFCYFGPWPQPYQPLYGQIIFFETCLFAKDVLKNFSPFCFASPNIIGVKFGNRQTDKLFDTIYVDFFFQLNLLHPYLLHSQGS